MSVLNRKYQVEVTEAVSINALVKRFSFRRVDGQDLPTFSGGAHVVVEMRDGSTWHKNAYSLMSDPEDRSLYSISVRRDDEGRGGSLFMHKHVEVGDRLTIGSPLNLFALDLRAKKHLLIAGGIGITPFIAQIYQLCADDNSHFELHYATRNPALCSYGEELHNRYGKRVHCYYDDKEQSIPLNALLAGQVLGTHVYVCGPRPMIDWVVNTAEALGWPKENIHYEEFLSPTSGAPFKVELAASNKTVTVGEHESLLEAIEATGVDMPSLCRGGVCGQCETKVLKANGEIIHRDHWLDDDEKALGQKIMPCVSRFEGDCLTLDR